MEGYRWLSLILAILVLVVMSAMSQAIIGHQHPHRVVAVAPCPACLDSRLTEHYRARRCRPVIPGGCQCPSRFDCHDIDPSSSNINTNNVSNPVPVFRGRSLIDSSDDPNYCDFRGSRYPIGEIIPTDDPCRICICHYMDDGTLGVDCETKIECPAHRTGAASGYMTVVANGRSGQLRRRQTNQTGNFSSTIMPLVLYCYDYYTHDQCCPRQECMPVNPRNGRAVRQRKTCYYSGREYQLGERIKLNSIFDRSIDDHENDEQNQLEPDLAENLACLKCICTKRWNNTEIRNASANRLWSILSNDHISCRRKSCQLDLEPRFRRGCIPVYHPDKCCPIDFICPRTRQMATKVRGLDFGATMCKYEGRKYPVGARIYQNKHWAKPCIDCECRIPPEFTCLRRPNCNATGTGG